MSVISKVKEIAYHRNGVSGEGFFVVLFDGKREDDKGMMAIVIDHDNDKDTHWGKCYVLNAAETAKGNIAFAMGNSWRGDYYEPELRDAIKAYKEDGEKS